MKGRFLMASNAASREPNIYADKSSLVLEWLLLKGVEKDRFSIREVASNIGISVGQVQKVFGVLTMNGCLLIEGLRTAKKFMIKKPQILFNDWLDHYSILKKCKMRTYRTSFEGRTQLVKALKNSNLNRKVALALHSAAEAYGCKNSNLETLELYLLESGIQAQLEKILQLEPQERGYEVLLIEPYYKSMLNRSMDSSLMNEFQSDLLFNSPILLTFLDLYHFPLRGREQAEFMAERVATLKRIYKKGS